MLKVIKTKDKKYIFELLENNLVCAFDMFLFIKFGKPFFYRINVQYFYGAILMIVM